MSNGNKKLNLFFLNNAFLGSFNNTQDIPNNNLPECCFIGRSNVGKSSIINAITKTKNLAKTSKTPGRTQLVNFFDVEDDCRIVDLPGYGFAAVSKNKRKHWDELISEYFRTRDALNGVFLIIDSRRMITELDQLFLDFYLPLDKNEVDDLS